MSLRGFMRGVCAFFIAFLMATVASAEEQVTVEKEASLEAGRAIYNFRCYFCHGYNGDADTVATTFLTPPPKNFVNLSINSLTRKQMIRTVRDGKAGTAMAGFSRMLSNQEVEVVVDFVRKTFMQDKAYNLAYHTPVNGWLDGARNSSAAPFALGEVSLDAPDEGLTQEQLIGKQIYMQSCIACHDRMKKQEAPVEWDKRAVSYPRAGYSHRQESGPDTLTGATPYAQHDLPVVVDGLSAQEKKGETLFLVNCAFCHAANGTGKNWIGTFIEPHPRDLTDAVAMQGMTKARMVDVIKDGLPGTTMPAWRSVLSDDDIGSIISYVSRVFYPLPGV